MFFSGELPQTPLLEIGLTTFALFPPTLICSPNFVFCSLCFFSMDSASTKNRFMKQINSSFGSGGMGLAMTEVEFSSFMIYLKLKPTSSPMPIRKAVTVIGEQNCGKVWVFGYSLHSLNNTVTLRSINIHCTLMMMDVKVILPTSGLIHHFLVKFVMFHPAMCCH